MLLLLSNKFATVLYIYAIRYVLLFILVKQSCTVQRILYLSDRKPLDLGAAAAYGARLL